MAMAAEAAPGTTREKELKSAHAMSSSWGPAVCAAANSEGKSNSSRRAAADWKTDSPKAISRSSAIMQTCRQPSHLM